MNFKKPFKQVLTIILDGYGINPNRNKNAVADANTPHLRSYFDNYPFTTIEPGGVAVGLPKGVSGNSEVGHMNLGAGRPVRQDLVRINEAITQNKLKDMEKLKELISTSKSHSNRVHILGLLSDGGVHSHIDHIKRVIEILNTQGLEVFFHAFMDGRDTSKTSGVNYITDILNTTGFHFASMQGRSIGMDRDRRWEKIEHCYKVITGAMGSQSTAPLDYLNKQYEQNIFDEFVTPVLFNKDYAIKNDDSVFFINFRPDRARQITLALTDPHFNEFSRTVMPHYFLCMTPYVEEEVPELPILFDKEKIPNPLSQYLSEQGLKQVKIAETEKYAHVTYFFNGGQRKPFEGEKQILIPSNREVKTYDQKPEMSAPEVTVALLEELKKDDISFYLVNYANSDMVGHTGNYEAAIKALETLDTCVHKVVEFALSKNMAILITADHGNSDQMVYEDGSPHTSHSDAPAPFCLITNNLTKDKIVKAHENCALKDVAPTILELLGLKAPELFTGKSIFKEA